MNSVAETELLSQVAALLMPNNIPIEETFRNFPAPEGWGGHYLEPDLSLYGVLKDEDAALFVEYDGYWRHEGKEGMKRDRLKNAALLRYAPSGSCVIRISHAMSKPLEDHAIWVKVDTWTRGDAKSLSTVLKDVLVKLRTSGIGESLHSSVENRINAQLGSQGIQLSQQAQQLASSAAFVGEANTSEEISKFLLAEGFGRQEAVLIHQKAFPFGISIEKT